MLRLIPARERLLGEEREGERGGKEKFAPVLEYLAGWLACIYYLPEDLSSGGSCQHEYLSCLLTSRNASLTRRRRELLLRSLELHYFLIRRERCSPSHLTHLTYAISVSRCCWCDLLKLFLESFMNIKLCPFCFVFFTSLVFLLHFICYLSRVFNSSLP